MNDAALEAVQRLARSPTERACRWPSWRSPGCCARERRLGDHRRLRPEQVHDNAAARRGWSSTPRRWPRWTRCSATASPGSRRLGALAAASPLRDDEDRVGEPVLDGLVRLEEAVAVDVAHHLLDVAARVVRDQLRVAAREREELARGDLDVGRRAAEAARSPGGSSPSSSAGRSACRRRRRRGSARPSTSPSRCSRSARPASRTASRRRSRARRSVRPASSCRGGCRRRVLGLEEEQLGDDEVRRRSSTSVPRKTIRSRSSREKMSKERSKRPSDSTTMGTRWSELAIRYSLVAH